MSEKRIFNLIGNARRVCADWVLNTAPEGWHVVASEPTRNLEQNAAQWPILEAFSKQLQWPVNGRMVNMTPDEWKDLLTPAFRQETVRLAMGLNGGVVMLGQRTSKFSKAEFSEWLEFLNATAAMRGVDLTRDKAAA